MKFILSLSIVDVPSNVKNDILKFTGRIVLEDGNEVYILGSSLSIQHLEESSRKYIEGILKIEEYELEIVKEYEQ